MFPRQSHTVFPQFSQKAAIFTVPRFVRDSLFVCLSALSLLYLAVSLKRKTVTSQQITALKDFRLKGLVFILFTIDMLTAINSSYTVKGLQMKTQPSAYVRIPSVNVLKQRTLENATYPTTDSIAQSPSPL